MRQEKDLYELLAVGRDASEQEIKQAYRQLARRFHPDVNREDPQAEEKFKEINLAYEVLSDADRRRRYDTYGIEGLTGNGGAGGFGADVGFADLIDMFFGGGMGRSTRAGGARVAGQPGENLRYDLELSLEEAAKGLEKDVTLPRLRICDACKGSGAKPGTPIDLCPTCRGAGQVRHTQTTFLGSFSSVAPCSRCRGEGSIVRDPCVACDGTGRVRGQDTVHLSIPPGVDTGNQLRVTGQGHAGASGGRAGDLYVVLHVRPHPLFQRRDNDLFLELPISFSQAALGATVEVPTLDGDASVTIPAGTQSATVFTLRDQGMPDVNNPRRRGHLRVAVRVVTPTSLSEEQRQLLKRMAALGGDQHIHEHGKGLLGRIKELLLGQDGE